VALTPRIWAIPLVLSGLAAFLPSARAGALRKVREVDLTKAVHRSAADPGFPVFAIRFSPDGQKLAVIADVYGTQAARKSRLLILDIDHPVTSVGQFEVGWGILESESGRVPNFGWAPSGEIIYALGRVIHLASGTSCELPSRTVFIGDDLALSAQPYPPPLYSSTRLTFFNQDCKEGESWEVPEGWLVSDVSTDRRLLSVLKETTNPTETERLIVDPIGRKVLQRWHENIGGAWEFADKGKAVCQGGNVLQRDRAPARCRDVDTGREIGETLRNGIEPIAAASGATRAVVSDYQRMKVPFDYEYRATFKGRFVWDFGTGKELASWMPESETYQNVFTQAKQVTEPFRFAISPDGQYIAEGGNGIVRLYKIEP
jgi:WD40-like Beta Propeller Repeat